MTTEPSQALSNARPMTSTEVSQCAQQSLLIFDSDINVVLMATDCEGRITGWNHGAETLFGWSAQALRGLSADRLSTLQDQADHRFAAEMQQALATGRADGERQYLRKDGALFWGSGNMVPLRGGDGAHVGFFKILRDITAERQAAEAQRADAEFLRSVLAASGDCIKVLDLDAKLTFMSERGMRLLEVSDFNAIRGCAWADFWLGELHTQATAAVAAARAGGLGHFVGQSDTMMGTPKWWDVQVTPILGADGKPDKLLCVSRDISQANRTDQLLALSEERLAMALGASGVVATWDWDLATGLVYADENYARIYGFDAARAAAGAPLDDYLKAIHPQDVQSVRWGVDRTLADGAAFSCEYRVIRPDDSVRWIFARGRLVRNAKGVPARFAGTSVDVTEQKSAQERQAFLLQLSDRLRVLDKPEAVLLAAAQALGQHLGVSRVGFGQVQPDDATVTFQSGYVKSAAPLHGSFLLLHFGADNIARMRLGRTVVCHDTATDTSNHPANHPTNHPANWQALAVQSFVAVPLLRAGRLSGALVVNCSASRQWLPGEVALMEDVAARAWDALERAWAESALRISEQRLLSAVAITSLGLFEWDTGSNAVVLSERSREIFGFGPTEGTQADELFGRMHLQDVDRVRAEAMKAARDASRLETSYRIVLPDGAVRWVKSVNNALPVVDGQAVRQVGVFEDVTLRVLADQTLRTSESQFRTLAQSIPHHVWTAHPNGQLDWFNDRVYAYSNTLPGELDEGRWVSTVHPDDVVANAARWAAALSSGDSFESEMRVRRHDGAYRWHLARAEAVRDLDGQIVRWVGTTTDIDDQHAAREALTGLNLALKARVEQQTAQRDRAWKNSRDLQLILGADGIIRAANEAWTTMLGWHPDEVVGRSHLDFSHPEHRHADAAALVTAGTSVLAAYESRNLHKDGSYRWVSWASAPEDSMVYASGRHVTAEKQAAADLQVAQEQLRQSQKMEAVGQLTGGVAHDFNNLLQVISANLQLMAKHAAGNEKIERRLASAEDAVRRGAKLAGQLLAFSRRQALAPKVINVGRFVLAMEDMLGRAIGEAIDIETVVCDGPWNALIDPTQIENAVLNLAINGRDAMGGQGTLTMTVSNVSLDQAYARQHAYVPPGDYVRLAISDTGCGMTAEVMAQVFEPFFSTKPVGSGSGLGLSMVYGFVKQSGGHVEIQSQSGHGTTIELFLPRTEQLEDVIVAADSGPVLGGSETILVAEDDDGVRATVVELLVDLGYRVLRAKDAASALTVIESGIPIDLLFTDVVMPGRLKSLALARMARQSLPGIAVLFTSGYTQNVISYGDGMDVGVELLPKPYTREALARRIRQVLALQAGRGQVAEAPAGPAQPASAGSTRPGGLHVLLVDHDDRIRPSTVELLQDLGHAVVDARNATEAMALLQATRFDVLVTDLGLPDVAGDVFAAQARSKQADLRIVFATGSALAPQVIADGMSPVLLLKPYDGAGLASALAAAIGADAAR